VPNNDSNLGYPEHPGYVELVGLNTPFQSEQEFDHLRLASLISTRDTDHWLTDDQRLSILASGRPSTPLASPVTPVNPIPGGWLLDWNLTPPQNQAPVLTTSSSGSNYRTPEGQQIPLPISEPVTPPLTTTTTTPQAPVRSRSTPGVTPTPGLEMHQCLTSGLQSWGYAGEWQHQPLVTGMDCQSA
jgi:hypothetical protein